MARVLLLFIRFATAAGMLDQQTVVAQLEDDLSASQAGSSPSEGSVTTGTEPFSLNSARQAFGTFIRVSS